MAGHHFDNCRRAGLAIAPPSAGAAE
jgi:hypothetical protein